MDNSIELKRYHIMEYLMKITDIDLLEKVEKVITQNYNLSEKEIITRATISEEQLKKGQYKTHQQAVDRLQKWTK